MKEVKKYISENEILSFKENGKCIYEDSNGIYVLVMEENKKKKEISKNEIGKELNVS